ncbi:MAG: response regulator transcription factor [Arcobacteraceae bacterium]|nr:response regulator transcription factor [Arcobacteraceae bacterium]
MNELAQILKELNILYAEDNQSIQASTRKTLELIFGNVYIANDGLEALDIYNSKTIHMALFDYVMPNMNGYEAARQIRLDNKKIPIIIASGYSDKDKLLNAIDLGVIKYIEKPLKYDELVNTLKLAVEILRENNMLSVQLDEQIHYDLINKTISKNGDLVRLTKQESDFLELLINNKSKLVSKELINDYVFASEYVDPNTMRNVLYRLRKKLDSDIVVTIKDLGYMIQ